jgi:hypothetical protein
VCARQGGSIILPNDSPAPESADAHAHTLQPTLSTTALHVRSWWQMRAAAAAALHPHATTAKSSVTTANAVPSDDAHETDASASVPSSAIADDDDDHEHESKTDSGDVRVRKSRRAGKDSDKSKTDNNELRVGVVVRVCARIVTTRAHAQSISASAAAQEAARAQ